MKLAPPTRGSGQASRWRPTAITLTLGLVVAGCSTTAPPQGAPELPPNASVIGDDHLHWNDEIDLGELEVSVGSKSTVEQEILGHLAAEALAAAGATVIDQIDLGRTLEVRDAQLAGLIDLYWEYTGTGWVDLLREIGPSRDPTTLAEAVAETDLDENGISWLTPAPADSSAALARGPNVAEGLAVETVSELGEALAAGTEGLVVCIPDGGPIPGDARGLPSLQDGEEPALDPGQVMEVPGEDLVAAVEIGVFCPVGEISRTSPELIGADLQLLEDDVGAFLVRNPTVTVREEILSQFPQMQDVLDPIAAALTDEQLRELQADVLAGGDPREVARSWLVDEGFADH